MAARTAFGAVCRRLWQVLDGLGRLGGLTGIVAFKFPSHQPLCPSAFFLIFIPHLAPFTWKWREKGLVLSEFSHGIKHKLMSSGKDRNKNNRRMSKLEKILYFLCSKTLLLRLQNKLRLREDRKFASRKLRGWAGARSQTLPMELNWDAFLASRFRGRSQARGVG